MIRYLEWLGIGLLTVIAVAIALFVIIGVADSIENRKDKG